MMSMIVVMTALAFSILMALAFGVWWLDRRIQDQAFLFHEVADLQSRQLSMVSADAHAARIEVGRTREELGGLRNEVDVLVYGPPSIAARVSAAEPAPETEATS